MKKYLKAAAVVLCASIIASSFTAPERASAASAAREVEYLGRGGYGIAADNGVYLSWRLLGTEPMEQTFDIYRNDEKIAEDIDATNYTDANGRAKDVYKVTPHNGEAMENDVFIASARDYKDVILDKPAGGDDFTYEFNEVSVGDVDNDGEYEFIVKWDPTNRQDNSIAGYTGNVLIDCYKQDGKKLWRIDLGKNIRAGSHYTQLVVYDFDGDGKAEMALRTAPGSKDSSGQYVSSKGAAIDGEALTFKDAATGESFTDEDDLRSTAGGTLGKILKGPDWITMFNGETGEAMQTINYYPQRGNVKSWGDDYANRSERYNAGVAYLDGERPSLVMARGYYMRAAMAAYNWNGKNFSLLWKRDDNEGKMNKTLYGNGDHQISICDADNDGKDEIVFGSTVVDDDGSILNSTDHGHGDALHVSDFDNDGEQEIFQVHEDAIGYKKYGAEVRKAKDASIIAAIPATGDVGRGLMGNFDDEYNDTSEFFSSADSNTYDFNGNKIGAAPANINPSFLIWWNGDLSREILSRTTITKYDIATETKKVIKSFSAVHFGDKDAPALSADLLGDWREEICYPTEDNGTLRIFMTTTPTDYKMPALMHDTQYRTAVAWQNTGYNQPPHPKFYVGKAALAANGRYLAPAAGFDNVKMTGDVPKLQYPKQTDTDSGVYTVSVNAVGDIEKTIASQEIKGGESFEYGFPRYILENGFVYEAPANSTGTHYGGSIANVTKDTVIPVTYTKKYSGVVYLDDINIEKGSKGADIRASNCLAQDNKPYTSSYILKPGISYTIILGYQNSYRGSSFVADGKTLHTVTRDGEGVPAGTWGTYTISGVAVEHESPLSLAAGPNKTYDPLDTIVIINETAQTKEDIRYDMTALDETELSVIKAASVTADAVTIAGVKNDGGGSKPSGYIAFTAPANGTLSLTFESSATRTDNFPRLYYCTDAANMTKNNSSRFFQANGADEPLDVKLDVTEGTTYYLFGYLYRYTSDFYYTIKDVSFTPSFLSYQVTFKDYDGTVLKIKDIAAGAMPDYSGTPQRDADDMYEYEFGGWSPEFEEVTEEAVYTAQYTQKDRAYYDVNLILNGGTIANGKEVTRHIYGQSETLPSEGEIVRDGYTFDGWYENKALTGAKISAIPADIKGATVYYAKWVSDSGEVDIPKEYIDPLGDFTDKITIEKLSDENGEVTLIVSPKEEIGDLTLYTAVYKKSGVMVNVSAEKFEARSDGTVAVKITKPTVSAGEKYKIMLWNEKNTPLIKTITSDTIEFFM